MFSREDVEEFLIRNEFIANPDRMTLMESVGLVTSFVAVPSLVLWALWSGAWIDFRSSKRIPEAVLFHRMALEQKVGHGHELTHMERDFYNLTCTDLANEAERRREVGEIVE